MKKIIHMSDVHVGYKNFNERFGAIIDNLIFEKGDKASEYIIVITGDLVHNANKKESFGLARKGLDVLRQSGFKHVLVIPGNHDYGTGNKGNKKFVKLFKNAFYQKELEYPKIDILDGIALIGLDSMAEELHWYDALWAQGELGKKQLRKLSEVLLSSQVRACRRRVIYLHHHPFQWRPLHQLKDSQRLKKVLTQVIQKGISIDAILFGHNHQGRSHNGHWGIKRCYDAGTTTLKDRPRYLRWASWFKIQSSTRVINLEKEVFSDYVLSLL